MTAIEVSLTAWIRAATINWQYKECFYFKRCDTKGEKVSHTRVLIVLTHHTTWFISLGWNSLLQFFQEFASVILCKGWFEILTSSMEVGTFSRLALLVIIIIKQAYLFCWNLNIMHPYKQPVNNYYSSVFTVSFYFFFNLQIFGYNSCSWFLNFLIRLRLQYWWRWQY